MTAKALPTAPYYIRFSDFATPDQWANMAFPIETTLEEIKTAADNLVDQGKVRIARVVNAHCWEQCVYYAGWQRVRD